MGTKRRTEETSMHPPKSLPKMAKNTLGVQWQVGPAHAKHQVDGVEDEQGHLPPPMPAAKGLSPILSRSQLEVDADVCGGSAGSSEGSLNRGVVFSPSSSASSGTTSTSKQSLDEAMTGLIPGRRKAVEQAMALKKKVQEERRIQEEELAARESDYVPSEAGSEVIDIYGICIFV